MLFLKFMHVQDSDVTHFEVGGPHALALAEEAAELARTSSRSLYQAYAKWKEEDVIGTSDGVKRPGGFRVPVRGLYERQFLLNKKDLKSKLKKWMRKNEEANCGASVGVSQHNAA